MPARPDAGREPLSSSLSLRPAASDGEPVPASRADRDQPLGHISAPVGVLDQESFGVGIPNITGIYDGVFRESR